MNGEAFLAYVKTGAKDQPGQTAFSSGISSAGF
jgi:hypothetical protein